MEWVSQALGDNGPWSWAQMTLSRKGLKESWQGLLPPESSQLPCGYSVRRHLEQVILEMCESSRGPFLAELRGGWGAHRRFLLSPGLGAMKVSRQGQVQQVLPTVFVTREQRVDLKGGGL